ncbi:hypothetical protein ACT17_32815 [Mycolicibacterium conceptionense]|uniref:Uncharacterized protein n=1 Tax=Mycolicibacterium conceptionense TaxID=451644 RepID=A0A0J8U0A5_9MYCO|nr:hypothetical protein [Mycolicibacterium conceptionense]KMV13965.1 hypothetical protein ACT17_32815 [Mycolicibacterium conceptionense]
MSDQYWEQVNASLDAAIEATTADDLIAAVKLGPNQGSGDAGAQAFFAGSGGDTMLADVLEDGGHWDVDYAEGDYHWKATSKADGSTVEYIEGDLYRRAS